MAHLSNAIFTGIHFRYSADTGSGGLAESGDGTARIHHLLEEDEPQPETMSEPWCRLIVRESEEDRIGEDACEAIVEFVIYTNTFKTTANRKAVVDRIRERYHDQTLSLTGWTLGGIHRIGGGPLGNFGQWKRWSERFIVYATES
jgi:hypothetical protein